MVPWWQHAAGGPPDASQVGAGNYSPQNLNALMPWANQMPWAMPSGFGQGGMPAQGMPWQGMFGMGMPGQGAPGQNLAMFGQAAQQPVAAPGSNSLAMMLQALMAQQQSPQAQLNIPNPQTWQPTPNAAPAAQQQSPFITSLGQIQLPPQPVAAPSNSPNLAQLLNMGGGGQEGGNEGNGGSASEADSGGAGP